MGYMRHNAIIVTSSTNTQLLQRAHDMAVELGMSVTDITSEVTNGYRSFLIAPDGSKEGWDTSSEGDQARDKMASWLDEQRHEDDSTPLQWVEVQYGDEELQTEIVRDSDDARRWRRRSNDLVITRRINRIRYPRQWMRLRIADRPHSNDRRIFRTNGLLRCRRSRKARTTT